MAVGKEIRTKIKSVENTKKITKAMEMVAASKMRKAQDRMRASRPYSEKIVDLIGHFSQSNPEYRHPFMNDFPDAPNVGIIVISTDKGLCGGLNTNVFRHVLAKVQEAESKGKKVKAVAIGNKALSFLSRIDVEILYSFVQVLQKYYFYIQDHLLHHQTCDKYQRDSAFLHLHHQYQQLRPLIRWTVEKSFASSETSRPH